MWHRLLSYNTRTVFLQYVAKHVILQVEFLETVPSSWGHKNLGFNSWCNLCLPILSSSNDEWKQSWKEFWPKKCAKYFRLKYRLENGVSCEMCTVLNKVWTKCKKEEKCIFHIPNLFSLFSKPLQPPAVWNLPNRNRNWVADSISLPECRGKILSFILIDKFKKKKTKR